MPTLLQQAARGQRKAMTLLYDTHKQAVYHTACRLLGHHSFAPEATAYAFKNGWACIAAEAIEDEAQFRQMLLRKTADYAKRHILKTDSRAFRLPRNRNFLLPPDTPPLTDAHCVEEAVLEALPPMQRFILVLHAVSGLETSAVAELCNTDARTVEMALEAIPANVARLTRALSADYDGIVANLRQQEEMVPLTIDTRVAEGIHRVAAPIEQRRRRRLTTLCTTVLAAVALVAGVVWLCTLENPYADTDTVATDADTATDTDTTEDSDVITSPIIELDTTKLYYADIEIADYGTVTVQLEPDDAPITVANFVNLAQEGFYDGLTFHRIIEGMMMQGGDPNGDGTGDAGANIYGEFVYNGYANELSHTRGAISMARADDYDSGSCQFFIVQEDYTAWDGQYAVFGYVTEGMDVVDAVCQAAEPTDSNGTIPADQQPVITSVTIRTESENTTE